MLRFTKISMAALVAIWAFAGATFNVMHWSETTGAVAAATSMSTFEGGADNWRATTNPAIIVLGAVFIVAMKLLTGVLCLLGAAKMWAARKAAAADFVKSKELAIAGCGVAMILLFGGWIVAAETWFELWRSDALRDISLQSAFRYGAMITLIALFIGARND